VFVVFKADTSIVVWGNRWYGGDTFTVSAQLTSGVVCVALTVSAFAALKADGSVVPRARARTAAIPPQCMLSCMMSPPA
jgi:exosortase/archaeosortase